MKATIPPAIARAINERLVELGNDMLERAAVMEHESRIRMLRNRLALMESGPFIVVGDEIIPAPGLKR